MHNAIMLSLAAMCWRPSPHWRLGAARRAGQGQGRRLPGQLVAALFRGARARLLQGTEHRAGDDQADRRPAERRRHDHQPDRRLGGAGDDRRAERRSEEARRRDVHLAQQPEQDYQMEQFVVRTGYQAKSLKDLKGAKIMSAPGPANVTMAKAALAAVGLKEGDYTIDQLDMAQHVNAMKAGTFDAGYTLEPNASTMRKLGIARTLEAGVIAHYVLGDPNANAFVAGCALTTDFIKNRPDVAKRFAAAWAKAVHFINSNPAEARKHLAQRTRSRRQTWSIRCR